MLNKSKLTRFLSLSIAVAGLVFVSGHFSQADAQVKPGVDPFKAPEWKKPKSAVTPGAPNKTSTDKKPAPVGPVPAPAIEMRINYYKQERERLAALGQTLPKVTSVLTLDEMSITGIFKTPRGFAAMVEATPIRLSYTIYPGEKFFDGQLVAIEENRLVFRKVVKMSNGKFISSVENKTLRQYTVQQEVQGTAPVENNSAKTEVVNNNAATTTTPTTPTTTAQTENLTKPVTPAVIVSPVDEMNRQPESKPEDSVKDKNKKTKKPTKVAKKS